ncbi:hypothetical protein NDU88_000900 [Pleurodeles waltl]|uniref:Uncharacterized protein n=1 Tax=Pleurodeles waltl TaxID=8319 RepID=A0AAV7LY61_PLEWA|nr:hypothetical protein NDU88_000900 [Pleurodeles waltl]
MRSVGRGCLRRAWPGALHCGLQEMPSLQGEQCRRAWAQTGVVWSLCKLRGCRAGKRCWKARLANQKQTVYLGELDWQLHETWRMLSKFVVPLEE